VRKNQEPGSGPRDKRRHEQDDGGGHNEPQKLYATLSVRFCTKRAVAHSLEVVAMPVKTAAPAVSRGMPRWYYGAEASP